MTTEQLRILDILNRNKPEQMKKAEGEQNDNITDN